MKNFMDIIRYTFKKWKIQREKLNRKVNKVGQSMGLQGVRYNWATELNWYGILLSHKKEWNNAIYSSMDGPRGYHTKWSKSERERRNHIRSLTYGIKNITQMNLPVKQTHRHREQTCSRQGWEGWGGMEGEFGISRCKTFMYKTTKSYCIAQGTVP